ncbi:MAG: peptidoglycan DD-metalloendopeptidase family protein [Bacteroidia bacterium]|nr:peptidoglycan DD-metalloendopeptidase family protein [Bacteroidia bacterium]
MVKLPRLLLTFFFGSTAIFWSCQPSESSKAEAKVTNPLPIQEAIFGYDTDGLQVVQAVVQPNENLSEILSRYQISMSEIAQLANLSQEEFDVRKILANRPYTVLCSKDSAQRAHCFIYEPNTIDYVAVEFGENLSVKKGSRQVDTVTHTLSGVIESSLYNSIVQAGGSPALVNALAEIYAWEIDFFGLQTGDHFSIFYTTHTVEGVSVGLGHILSASFKHMGKELLAFRYDQGEGHGAEYFDEEGNSLRKTFLKAPLSYTRISSHFSHSRLHPVLKIRRPHHGVDYAAPIGTPVVAVGDGVITKADWGGGGGKTVKIRHNSNYETAYLHLSRYGDGIRPGQRVSQGQVIGYVGSTGLSTGPHLDFRFYKNGTPVDPLHIEAPSAGPITDEKRASFLVERNRFLQVMDDLHRVEARENWLAISTNEEFLEEG